MASENFLNLIQEFKEIRGYELAFFTTFSFDPIFFENVILRTLRRNNPAMATIVLVDAEHYPKPAKMTSSTGIDYLLIPVSRALFHPKVFLFLSEKKDLAYIGSHNLTLSGFTHNLELTYKTEERALISSCIEFFLELFSRISIESPIIDTLSKKKKEPKEVGTEKYETQLLHNLNKPILKTALEYVMKEATQITKIRIFAPFFSNEVELLKQIIDTTKVNNIELCIQRNNHNLNVDNIQNVPFVSLKEIISNRTIHSKFFIFSGHDTFVLVGSPNFTEPALNRTIDNGNVEVAIIGKLENQNLFDELTFKEISVSDAKNSTRQMDLFSPKAFPSHEVTLIMALIDDYGELILHYDGVADEKQLSLVLQTSSDERKIPIILEPNTKQKAFQAEIAGQTTVWLEKDGNIVSNKIRVYNPSGSKLRIMDYKPDIDRIPSLIANAKDPENLIQIILALLPEERHLTVPEKPHLPEPSPGRMLSGETGESMYDILMRLFRVPRAQVAPRSITEGPIPPSPNKEKEPRHIEINHNYLVNLLDKWTTSFSKRKLAIDNSLLNYSAYLLISLKLIEFFVKSNKKENRMQFLIQLTNHIASLIDKYGFSKIGQKDLQLFIPIILYLENETSATTKFELNFKINKRIAKEMKELENLIAPSGNSLEGLKFREQVLAKWDELKLTPSNPDTSLLSKLVSSLVAATILGKDSETRMSVYRGIVKDISEVRYDADALFLSYILQFSITYDTDNKNNLRLEIKRMKERPLRGFRRTLYGDILNPNMNILLSGSLSSRYA
jgi:hypothetical protein